MIQQLSGHHDLVVLLGLEDMQTVPPTSHYGLNNEISPIIILNTVTLLHAFFAEKA